MCCNYRYHCEKYFKTDAFSARAPQHAQPVHALCAPRLTYIKRFTFCRRNNGCSLLDLSMKGSAGFTTFKLKFCKTRGLNSKLRVLTLSPPNKFSAKLVCFNFLSASMSLKVGEINVCVSHYLAPDETTSYSASRLDLSCLHMALWLFIVD